ncbi:T9SS type B sorting domain-containing protein, partial [Flavobacterium sp. LHD-85]|uniref:T9SS type B sorting domain-containing protein n=1 Tax=Flavobacterium sp. LHD-85 TaxID=3071410 RepID=UPI0027DEFA2F
DSKPVDIVTAESICSGQTYTWPANGITYSTSQTGLKITNDECTADQVLNLTVDSKPVDIVTAESICSGQTYTWPANGITYSTSQTGLKITNDGCTADQVLNLTVGSKPADIVTTESICFGQTFTWPANGITYSTSQNALKIVNDGCTADQVLNLVVGSKPADIVTTESICFGQTFTWPANGITYSTSQNALKIVNDGCTADQVLNLVVGSKPADIVTSESICSGQTFTWPANGITYSTSQTGLKITNDGCTADQVLNLTVGSKPADIVTSESICSGQTFTWPANGITYSTSQTGLKITNDGCTADQVLNLTVTPKPTDIIKTIEICEGDLYPGLEREGKDGCTADIVYQYVLIPKPTDIVTTESICSGQTFTWPANGITYSTSQTGLKITNDGCTADQVLNLTVGSKPADIVTTESICSGQTFTWPANGITYSTSQTGLKITNDGCTADQVLNLTVGSKPADIVTSESICSGHTYTWPANGITYSTSQNALKIVNDGCTADQVLNLTVGSKPADIITAESICSGQTFTWPANGITYSTSQTGLKITNDGCTADQVLNLTVGSKPADIATSESICSGQTYTWPANGITYSTSQTGLKITNDGCTADQVLNLTIKEEIIITQLAFRTCIGDEFINKTVCELISGKVSGIGTPVELPSGLSLIWSASDNTIKLNGSPTELGEFWFSVPLITEDCGNKVAIGNIYIEPKPTVITANETICSGEIFHWNITGLDYNASGTYTKNNDGCTADQILNLTVASKPAAIITNETICSGTVYSWNVTGLDYNTSGTYTKNNDGCTADQILNLTVAPKPAPIAANETICSGEIFHWNITGLDYNTSGTYTKNNDGCTADQILNLTVAPKPVAITANETICSGEAFLWNITGLYYNTSGTYTKNNDGCTADQILNLTVASKPAAIITNETICSGTVYSWNVTGLDYNTSGTYTKNNDGCTADQILNLTVAPKPAPIAANETICSGEIFHWNMTGLDYNASGTYTKNNDGCTADQILNLTVAPKPAPIVTNETICSGEVFHWNITELDYNATGTYTKNNDGCTADQILNLTVVPKPAPIAANETICSGEVFHWNMTGLDYNASGTYTKNNDGCTADQILNLTVAPKPAAIVTNETICSGEVFHWNMTGLNYNTSGTYTKNNDGCTADQVLNLTVGSKPADVVTSKTICFGESYLWSVTGINYSVSTNLKIENDGCTADEVLNLNVGSALTSELIPNTLLRETCNGGQDGGFSIQITGGTVPYKVALNDINGIYQSVIDSDYTFSNLAGGQYIVYVKDALNCTTEQEVTIEYGIAMNPIANTNYTCEDNGPSNYVTITVPQSNAIFNEIDYSLDGGAFQSENVFKNLSPGSHTITARHLSGCLESTAPFIIDFIQPLDLSLTNRELNEITASGQNGSGNYQYSFEGESFSTNNKFIIYKSGTYNITVRDGSGCTFSASKYFDYIDLCISNYFTPNGDGISDYWGPDCSSSYKKLTYTIFDRYGRELANYHFGQKWDGKYKGQELTSGDYWYVIKLNDPKDNREFVGHFTLYR